MSRDPNVASSALEEDNQIVGRETVSLESKDVIIE